MLKIAAQPGQAMAAGEVALVIESMKLEHSLAPGADGVVAEVKARFIDLLAAQERVRIVSASHDLARRYPCGWLVQPHGRR